MAVTPQQLLAPVGEIESSFFPTDDDVTARLQHYVDDALAKEPTASDDAVKAWAYHRAYRAIYVAMSASPATATLNDEGSRSYLVTQIQNFRDLSDAKLREWERLIAAAEAPTSEESSGTRSVRVDYTW